jgi:hypothetical protein
MRPRVEQQENRMLDGKILGAWSVPSASLSAKANLLPAVCPLLAPRDLAAAGGAHLGGLKLARTAHGGVQKDA